MDITEIKIGVPTGVQDYLSWMKGISLFPNPTASNPTISFSLVTSDFATIRVFNALGNIIYQAKTASAQSHYHILNLNNQPPGIYWVTVQVSDKQMGLPLVIID
jgi:hypothetical protein